MSTERVKDEKNSEEISQNEMEQNIAEQQAEMNAEHHAADTPLHHDGEENDSADTKENEHNNSGANSFAELQEKLTAAERKAEENNQKYLRSQADYDNLRRRTRKEKEDQAKYASLPVIEKLLPAMDNFERALAASQITQDSESLAKGVEMVFRQLEQALTEEGLEVILTVGQPFDPTIHQAVMQVESEEHESGTVVEELQKGYKLKDKVIRPAMVKVNM